MAVDVPARKAEPSLPALPLALARFAALPARWALAGIVSISFAVRALLALGHVTPTYLPDRAVGEPKAADA